jgi:hypothetical protein
MRAPGNAWPGASREVQQRLAGRPWVAPEPPPGGNIRRLMAEVPKGAKGVSGRARNEVSVDRWQRVWWYLDRGYGLRVIGRMMKLSLRTIQHYASKGRPPYSMQYDTDRLFPDEQPSPRRTNDVERRQKAASEYVGSTSVVPLASRRRKPSGLRSSPGSQARETAGLGWHTATQIVGIALEATGSPSAASCQRASALPRSASTAVVPERSQARISCRFCLAELGVAANVGVIRAGAGRCARHSGAVQRTIKSSRGLA